MKITLSWPVQALWPNRKAHYLRKSDAARVAKNEGYYATKAGVWQSFKDHKGNIPLQVTFFPPDARRRDLDGMFSAMKNFLDGIALAIGVDDTRFRPISLDVGEVRKGGAVEVEI